MDTTSNANAAGKIAYAGMVAAILIPRIQATFGVTLTTDDIAAAMAATAVAWHALSKFIESRWPPRQPVTDDMVKQITMNVLAELRANPIPLAQPIQEKSP